MKLLTFDQREARAPKFIASRFPPSWRTRPSCGASEMLEQLFEYSNELAELVLEEAPVPADADPPACCARRRCTG